MCLLYLQRCQSVTESRGTEGEGYSVIGDAYLIVWMEKKRQKEHSGGAHALSSLCCCVTATWGVCHFKYMWKKKQSLPIEHLWVFIIFFSFFWTTLTIVFYFILRFVCGHVDYHHHNLVFLKFSETHKWSRRISLTNTWAQTSWMSCQDNESCQIICEITTVQILQKAQCCKAYLLKWESMDTNSLLVKNSSGHLGELHFFFFLSKFSCSH